VTRRVLLTTAAVVVAFVALAVAASGLLRGVSIAGAAAAVAVAATWWLAARRHATTLAVQRRAREDLAAGLEARIEEIRQEREQRESILEAMQDGVILLDDADRIRYATPAAGRVLAGTPGRLEELSSAALRTLVEDARSRDMPVQRTLETGVPTRSLQVWAVPMADGSAVLVLRDVTEAHRVEAMRRDFVADASHELKTPAAAIRAGADTVARAAAEDPEAAARFAAQVSRDAERLSRIVTDLLDLSRLEAERPDLSPVRLDQVTEEEVERLRGDAAEAGVSLEASTGPVTVAGSGGDLALMVRNLVENAIRYTPGGGRVRVDLSSGDGSAVLTVHDTGVGISSRDLPRVFERFYRVDPARSRETGGTGLGLSIARHVVEGHGGQIHARSELGRGSTFRVTLPLS
jgi:signal transduction histidine kinase